MRLRVKLYYIVCGFQSTAALLFALLGKLPQSLFAVFFGIMSWYGAEYWLKEELNALQAVEERKRLQSSDEKRPPQGPEAQ